MQGDVCHENPETRRRRSTAGFGLLGGRPFFAGAGFRQTAGQALGWGPVDDAESRRAIDCALDCGIDFFDTVDAYGTGHSERVLGAALKGRREQAVIATKFGNTYDEATEELTGGDASPAYIRRACEASLRRLGTDWIDLYQLHLGDLPPEDAEAVAEALEGLCEAGLIRGYGWSTDDPARAALFAGRPRALAVQHAMNVLSPAPEMLALCRREGLAGIVRNPLAMGLLSGKYGAESRLPADDIRAGPPDGWPWPSARAAARRRRCWRGWRRSRGAADQRGAQPGPGRAGLDLLGQRRDGDPDPGLPQ